MSDWHEGTPLKLKNVSLDTLEKEIASVVNKLVDGNGNIEAKITSFETGNGKNLDLTGAVSLKIELYKNMKTDIKIDFSLSEKE